MWFESTLTFWRHSISSWKIAKQSHNPLCAIHQKRGRAFGGTSEYHLRIWQIAQYFFWCLFKPLNSNRNEITEIYMRKKTRLVRCNNYVAHPIFFTLKIWFLDIGRSKVCSVGMVYFSVSKITAFVDNELKEVPAAEPSQRAAYLLRIPPFVDSWINVLYMVLQNDSRIHPHFCSTLKRLEGKFEPSFFYCGQMTHYSIRYVFTVFQQWAIHNAKRFHFPLWLYCPR